MKIIYLWLPVLGWAALIFFLSSIPGLSTGSEYDHIIRKMAHVLEYAILTYLLYRAFQGTFSLASLSLFFYPAILSFLYAISDEVHQLFVIHRNGSPEDVCVDTLGIAIFYLLNTNKQKIFKVFLKKSSNSLKK